jgi:hypothetical protein
MKLNGSGAPNFGAVRITKAPNLVRCEPLIGLALFVRRGFGGNVDKTFL